METVDIFKNVAKQMKDKLEKYYEDNKIPLLITIGCAMDPRFQLTMFDEAVSFETKSYIFQLMRKKSSAKSSINASSNNPTSTSNATVSGPATINAPLNPLKRLAQTHAQKATLAKEETVEDEFHKYLTYGAVAMEDPESITEAMSFDILSHWKTNAVNYPRLAEVAQDILGVPASSVESESAFSTGGRVVDEYRSRLSPKHVEMLICGGSWLTFLSGLSAHTK